MSRVQPRVQPGQCSQPRAVTRILGHNRKPAALGVVGVFRYIYISREKFRILFVLKNQNRTSLKLDRLKVHFAPWP